MLLYYYVGNDIPLFDFGAGAASTKLGFLCLSALHQFFNAVFFFHILPFFLFFF